MSSTSSMGARGSLSSSDLAEARRRPPVKRILVLTAFAAFGLALMLALAASDRSNLFGAVSGWLKGNSEDTLDQSLQLAATSALGKRAGTVIIMDPQTGRVRAVVNSKGAFEEALRPGSTIKPFTTLAALRSNIIAEGSESTCREKYSHDEFHTTCSHPRDLPPLNPTEAIAYSCNYYFGNVGERLTEPGFGSTLADFGFGKPTGINRAESPGKLLHSQWRPQNAMGEGDYLQTTPIQLINAYSALVNGGHLFTPRVDHAKGFVPHSQTEVAINSEHRALILKGMRGAVRYGTAESAGLYSLPIYTFGKTGTATEINGFRMQGWFVGFATATEDGSSQISSGRIAPDEVELAVLVFLSRGHGAEAAEVARPIFATYARLAETQRGAKAETRGTGDMAGFAESPRLPASGSLVRVHVSPENITRTMPLEDYVRGVVAAEGSTEGEIEALKALAVASRTYAVKNLHRHAKDGYDFCSTTHCQRYEPPATDSAASISPVVVEAVGATKGQLLLGIDARVADSYFSASCGGATANLSALWGGVAPPHLRGVPDDYCGNEPHGNWTDTISQAQLFKALKSDARTNVGDHLTGVRVLRADASGRAELIALEGTRRVTVRGWDFKIIVGRVLGWNLLKSSRFTVERSGSNFIFKGSGFGHGLGLCQEGAHVMATRGASYRQILARYFPGTDVGKGMATTSWHEGSTFRGPLVTEPIEQPRAHADLLWNNAPRFNTVNANGNSRFARKTIRRTLSSEYFRISYPTNIDQREVEALLTFLQSNRKSFIARLAGAGINAQFPALEIFINETTGDFVGRTRQPPWAAAATRNNRIELQPLATLKRRRILETTLRHELVHTVVDIVGHGRTPRWLAEGLALHYADEGRLIAQYEPKVLPTTEALEKQLTDAKSANEMKVAYAAAYREVKRLISSEGETNVWRRVAR